MEKLNPEFDWQAAVQKALGTSDSLDEVFYLFFSNFSCEMIKELCPNTLKFGQRIVTIPWLIFRPFFRAESTLFVMSCVMTCPENQTSRIAILTDKCGILSLQSPCLHLSATWLQIGIISSLWPSKWTTNQVR